MIVNALSQGGGSSGNSSIGVSGDAGEGNLITLGVKYYVPVAEDFTIDGWILRNGLTGNGSIEIDIWKATGRNPVLTDSICNGHYPVLSNQSFNSDIDISDWDSLSFLKGDTVCFYIRTNSTLQKMIFAMTKVA